MLWKIDLKWNDTLWNECATDLVGVNTKLRCSPKSFLNSSSNSVFSPATVVETSWCAFSCSPSRYTCTLQRCLPGIVSPIFLEIFDGYWMCRAAASWEADEHDESRLRHFMYDCVWHLRLFPLRKKETAAIRKGSHTDESVFVHRTRSSIAAHFLRWLLLMIDWTCIGIRENLKRLWNVDLYWELRQKRPAEANIESLGLTLSPLWLPINNHLYNKQVDLGGRIGFEPGWVGQPGGNNVQRFCFSPLGKANMNFFYTKLASKPICASQVDPLYELWLIAN